MAEGKDSLRLWLRLLTCSTMIEREVRARLRSQFGATLPRFDMMAALEREPDGLNMGELSRRMMVSNGNVTGLVDRLVQEGLIERQVSEHDRRSARVRLTEQGRATFTRMARAHSDWLAELLAGISPEEQTELWSRLGDLKHSVHDASRAGPAPSKPEDE